MTGVAGLALVFTPEYVSSCWADGTGDHTVII